MVSFSNVRKYIHKDSGVWLPEDELKKDNNGLVKVGGEKSTSIQSYTKNFRQLGEAEERRNFLQERVYQPTFVTN